MSIQDILEPEDEEADYHSVIVYASEEKEKVRGTYDTHNDPRHDKGAKQVVRDARANGEWVEVESGYYD